MGGLMTCRNHRRPHNPECADKRVPVNLHNGDDGAADAYVSVKLPYFFSLSGTLMERAKCTGQFSVSRRVQQQDSGIHVDDVCQLPVVHEFALSLALICGPADRYRTLDFPGWFKQEGREPLHLGLQLLGRAVHGRQPETANWLA